MVLFLWSPKGVLGTLRVHHANTPHIWHDFLLLGIFMSSSANLVYVFLRSSAMVSLRAPRLNRYISALLSNDIFTSLLNYLGRFFLRSTPVYLGIFPSTSTMNFRTSNQLKSNTSNKHYLTHLNTCKTAPAWLRGRLWSLGNMFDSPRGRRNIFFFASSDQLSVASAMHLACWSYLWAILNSLAPL